MLAVGSCFTSRFPCLKDWPVTLRVVAVVPSGYRCELVLWPGVPPVPPKPGNKGSVAYRCWVAARSSHLIIPRTLVGRALGPLPFLSARSRSLLAPPAKPRKARAPKQVSGHSPASMAVHAAAVARIDAAVAKLEQRMASCCVPA